MVRVRLARRFAAASLLATLLAGAHAQTLGLKEALTEAATVHPSVRARVSQREAASRELAGADWLRYPSFGTRAQNVQGGSQAITRVEQPVWTGGRIQGRIDLAGANLGVAEAALSETQQQLLLDTASAFFEALRLQARLAHAVANEADHRQLLEIIQRRVAAEVSPQTDATQASARLQQAVSERLQAQRQLETTRLVLQRLTGRVVGEARMPRDVAQVPGDGAAQLAEASDHSPERRRLSAEVSASEAAIVSARSQLKPQVAVGYLARQGTLLPGEERGRAYLSIEFQTGAGLSSMSAIEAAIARREAARESIAAHDVQLRQAVLGARSDIEALAAQLEPARALVGETGNVVASYLRQFQVGRKSWLEVLNAQREKASAQYALADLESPLLAARARLLILTGRLAPGNLGTIDD